MPARKVYLGLPAYNEKDSIHPLFQKIAQLKEVSLSNLDVLFYDDGCTDGTKEVVQSWMNRSLTITYLDGVVNKGLGTGINTIIEHFVTHASSNDVLVIMDCDDTHDPAQIPQMISALEKNNQINIVIASRYRSGALISGVPFFRVVMSLGAAMLYKMVHPLKGARDYTCGYRLYTHEILARATHTYSSPLLKERGFSCMVELLLKLKHVGGKVAEIPLLLSYDNKRSASKMDVSGNAFRLFKKLLDWKIRGLA